MGRARPIEERFWEKVVKGTNCWEWQGGRDQWGYGLIWLNGKTERAHRLSFVWARSPIPDDKILLHSCDNARCVNPAHLRIGTLKENSQDMIQRGRQKTRARQTHCLRGHEFTPENTYVYSKGMGACRLCRKCSSIRTRKTYLKRMAANKSVPIRECPDART